MYISVPTYEDLFSLGTIKLAEPKSHILMVLSSLSSIFSGFMSLCNIGYEKECRYFTALTRSDIIFLAVH